MASLKYRLRPAKLEDLSICLEIDSSYVTTHVWQMDERFDQESLALEEIGIGITTPRAKIAGKQPNQQPVSFRVDFRPSRLPRPLAVPPPLTENQLLSIWKKTDYFVVAEAVKEIAASADSGPLEDSHLLGYLGLSVDAPRHLAWISSGAVELDWRRRGIGQALIKEVRRWADSQRLHSLMIEVQPKNYPAISFLQKNNFFFCGYNTAYYSDHEIALFFALKLHNR